MKTIHRTVDEIRQHITARQYYLDEGYDYETAEQYAWDMFYAGRRGVTA